MAPQVQKALIVPTKQAPWELRTDWPVPKPGPGQVLVKVASIALNPVDWAVQALGLDFITEYPWLGGCDGAGVVEEVGPEVYNFAIGDKIFFPSGVDAANASFQEYAVAIAENAAKIPGNISFDEAATIPLCLATALCSVWSHHPKASTVDFPAPWEEGGTTKFAGKPALIVGGATSVGQFAIQAARVNGFSPIITTASPKHEEYLKTLGVTHVLDRSKPDDVLLAQIPNITNGASIVYAFDAVGRPEGERLAYTALGNGGSYVTVMPGADKDIADLVRADDGKRIAHVFGSFRLPWHHALGVEVYKRLTGWLAEGTLVPNRVEVLPNGLAGIVEALQRFPTGKVSGVKLIVHPAETPSV